MTQVDPESGVEPASRTLRVLNRRTPVTTGWRAPATVRRAAVRRRRARWTAGTAAILAAAIATALSLGGSAGTHPPRALPGGPERTGEQIAGAAQLVAATKPITTAASSTVDAVVAAEQRLSLALLNQVGGGSNVTVSPASLYLALGMLQNGARGQTASEISQTLQANGISTDDQNAGLAALTHALDSAAAKAGIQLESANSIWQQYGLEVKQQFLDALSAYYQSGVWQVDFAHHMDDAINAIDAWTSEKTHGKITKLFDSLDPTTLLVLANAVYFHAKWQTPFDRSATEQGLFTTADGRQVSAKFMSGGPGLRAAVTDGYQAVQLPYAGGRFAALAVMPTTGSLADFVGSLTAKRLDAIAAGLRSGLTVSIPRFTTTSKLDLKPVLEALGMRVPFSDMADFSGMSPIALKVDQVIQRDFLQVGEYGTTAAAVTGISMVPLSAHAGPEVRLDHPFLFLVRDTRSGAILFGSEITDPSAG